MSESEYEGYKNVIEIAKTVNKYSMENENLKDTIDLCREAMLKLDKFVCGGERCNCPVSHTRENPLFTRDQSKMICTKDRRYSK